MKIVKAQELQSAMKSLRVLTGVSATHQAVVLPWRSQLACPARRYRHVEACGKIR